MKECVNRLADLTPNKVLSLDIPHTHTMMPILKKQAVFMYAHKRQGHIRRREQLNKAHIVKCK